MNFFRQIEVCSLTDLIVNTEQNSKRHFYKSHIYKERSDQSSSSFISLVSVLSLWGAYFIKNSISYKTYLLGWRRRKCLTKRNRQWNVSPPCSNGRAHVLMQNRSCKHVIKLLFIFLHNICVQNGVILSDINKVILLNGIIISFIITFTLGIAQKCTVHSCAIHMLHSAVRFEPIHFEWAELHWTAPKEVHTLL